MYQYICTCKKKINSIKSYSTFGWMDESGLWSAFNHSWSYHRLQFVGVYVLDPSCTSPTSLYSAFVISVMCIVAHTSNIRCDSSAANDGHCQYIYSISRPYNEHVPDNNTFTMACHET